MKLSKSAGNHRRARAAVGLLLAGIAATPAMAQTVSEPINELSFTADLRHDANVIRSSDVIAGLRGLEKSDDRLQVGASLRVARPFGRHSAEIDGFVGYDFYRHNTQLNRERINVSGDLNLDVGFCQVRLLPSVSRQQSDIYDLAVLNVPGIESVRNAETTQRYRGELRCGNAMAIRPLVYYARTYGDNSNPLRRISDYRGETIGAGISYSNPVLGSFDLSVERTTNDYPNRPATFGAGGYRLDQVKLATSRDIGAVLTANGYVAYSRVKPRDGAAESFTGLSWSLGLTFVPMTDLQLQADLSQQIKPSLGNDALYSRDRTWGVSANYHLGARTTIGVGFSRNDRLYRDATAILGPILSNDKLDQVYGRADFSASRRLNFGVVVGHERRNANGTFYDYRNTYVAVNTRFTLGNL